MLSSERKSTPYFCYVWYRLYAVKAVLGALEFLSELSEQAQYLQSWWTGGGTEGLCQSRFGNFGSRVGLPSDEPFVSTHHKDRSPRAPYSNKSLSPHGWARGPRYWLRALAQQIKLLGPHPARSLVPWPSGFGFLRRTSRLTTKSTMACLLTRLVTWLVMLSAYAFSARACLAFRVRTSVIQFGRWLFSSVNKPRCDVGDLLLYFL